MVLCTDPCVWPLESRSGIFKQFHGCVGQLAHSENGQANQNAGLQSITWLQGIL